MNNLKYITPEFFHNWLNDCPVKWERIEDNVDEISIKFFLPLEEENDNEIDKITDEFDKLERENDSLKSLLKEVN